MIDPIELHAWADGELAREDAEALKRAVSGSTEAKAEFEAIMAVKRILREKVGPIECSRQWTICVRRLDEVDRTRRVERLVSGRFAWGLSGALFVAILAAGVLHRGNSSSNVTTAELAKLMSTFDVSANRANDSDPSRDRHDDLVKDLMASARVSVDPRRLEVEGREYGEVDGHAATVYHLKDASGRLILGIMPGVVLVDQNGQILPTNAKRACRFGNTNCIEWTDGRGTLLLEGDRSFEDLSTFAAGLH